MEQNNKKRNIYLLISISIFLFISFLYLIHLSFLDILEKKIKDEFFLIRGPLKTTNNIIIVDIDEKSLLKLGQWPWERSKLATILYNLTKAKAGIIGLDIFFPEKDKKSPALLSKEICKVSKKNYDSDKLLAIAISKTPTILGFFFNFEKNITKNILPIIPAIFIEKNKKNSLLIPKGYIANIPIIQNSAYSSGYLNMIPDSDGEIRYLPLLMKYNYSIYPALSFEMFRLAMGINKIIINYNENGIENIQLKNLIIPTNPIGGLYINYRGPSHTFPYISASDVYFNTFDKNLVKNKFVLIGTSAIGLFDLRNTPFDTVFPGVEIHANIIDNLLKQDFLIKPQYNLALTILTLLLFTLAISISSYFLSSIISFIITLILMSIYIYFSFYMFKKNILINISPIIILIVILYLLLTIINYFFEEKKTLQLKKAFSKKVSPEVMKELLKYSSEKLLEPKEKEITIFFSDIRNFTTISEKLEDPVKVISFLNEYMTPMAKIITKHKGTIDKYIGDAIMAYWNAPNDVKNHADEALTSAIEQLNELKILKLKFKQKYNIDFDIGIGINTGIATIGEMGSEGRADYTVIGDSVNLASRVEGLNKYYKTHIIITQFTKEKLKNRYLLRELDLVKVKGKTKPIKIFEVIDFYKKDEKFEKELNIYYNALKLYRKGQFNEAQKIFEKLFNETNLYLYKLYIDRCKFLIQNPPKEWNGVYTYTTK